MARPKISAVAIKERHKRLDGATDMLVEVTLADGAVRWLGVRESDNKLVGQWEVAVKLQTKATKGLPPLVRPPETTFERKTVAVAKRRTLKAGIADLVAQVPALLRDKQGEGSSDFWALTMDDRKVRERQRRLEREFRVHELVTWPDGRFLARLSCTRVPGISTLAKCQLVLDAVWDRGQVSALGEYGSKRIEGVEFSLLRAAVVDRFRRYQLPELLVDVDNGYNEEREARAAFDRMARLRPDGRHEDLGVPNAVRSAGADREAEIEVVETYEGHRGRAYLLNTSRGWWCMEVGHRGLGGGLIGRFSGVWTGDTAFDTPVATARAILGRTECNGFTEAEARAQLRQQVMADIDWRWHSEASDGRWLISAVADLPDGRLAVRGACVFPADEQLPITTPRPVWRCVVTGMTEADRIEPAHPTVIDLNTGKPIPIIDQTDTDRLRAAVALLGTKDDKRARDVIVSVVLRRAAGFTSHIMADRAWAELVAVEGAVVREIDGDVDPVPTAITRAQLEQAYKARKARIEAEMEGEERAEALARLKAARRPEWPALLLQVLEEELPGHAGSAVAQGEAPGGGDGFDQGYADIHDTSGGLPPSAEAEAMAEPAPEPEQEPVEPPAEPAVPAAGLGDGWPTDIVIDCASFLDVDDVPQPVSWYALHLAEAVKRKALPWPAAPMRAVTGRQKHFEVAIDMLACGHAMPSTEVWAGLTPRQRANAKDKPLPTRRRCIHCLAAELAQGDRLAAVYQAEIARLTPYAENDTDATRRQRFAQRIAGLQALLEALAQPLPPVVDGRIGGVPVVLLLAWRNLEVTKHLTLEAWQRRFPGFGPGHLFAALIAAARDKEIEHASKWQLWGSWATAKRRIEDEIDGALGVAAPDDFTTAATADKIAPDICPSLTPATADELTVDTTGHRIEGTDEMQHVLTHGPAVATGPVPELSTGIIPSGEAAPKKNKGGRPRNPNFATAKERKAAWERANRSAKAKDAQDPNRAKGKPGRKRLYESQSARQKAYEQRKRQRLAALAADDTPPDKMT